MRRILDAPRPLAVPALLGVTAVALACGGEEPAAPAPPPPPEAPRPSRIAIEPDPVVVAVGDTVRLRARVFDERARVISDAPLTWASSDPAVAAVDGSGLLTGISGGRANITATSGPVNASAAARVQSVDRATLVDLHDATGGASWTRRGNWGSDEPVGSWQGVEANADGRVTALRLTDNGLRGRLPESLGDLAFLTELLLDGNEALSGPIPVSLSGLGLRMLRYGNTMLCTVRDESFRAWLNAIPTVDGELVPCNEERSDLMRLHDSMGGDGWTQSTNWGTDAPLGDWYGITVDSEGRVTGINLNRNNLSGTIPPEIRYFPHLRLLRLDYNRLEGGIPPEIGELTELRRMDLDGNGFGGGIPAEIGNLVRLRELWLGGTGSRLTGSIPPELGGLTDLRSLHLYEARFDGPIPEELGELTALEWLNISDTRVDGRLPASLGALDRLQILQLLNNRLTGPLPAELGRLDRLRVLLLQGNRFSGPLPPQFGNLARLFRLHIQDNAGLSGPLPDELTRLTALEEFMAHGTGLCASTDPAFRAWLNEIVAKWRVRTCGSEWQAEAYLMQAVQSREYPVPLVAGEGALLRVFVTSEAATVETLPPVRATFFVNGTEVHRVDIPAGSSAIPTEVREGELDLSANAAIPAEVIRPGLEMVVEVDPDGTVDAGLGVARRIPAEGRAAVEVLEVPPMHLTLVPFVYTGDNNREAEQFVVNADADDDIFFETRTLLPVADFEIVKHSSVTIDSNNISDMLRDLAVIRAVEEGTGHWLGLAADPAGALGIAFLGTNPDPHRGKVSVSRLDAETIAHELGHNLNLLHADCGGPVANSIDPSFPYPGGRTGAWGYDPRDGGSLEPPDRSDHMSYCDPAWVSDYSFTNALRFRLVDPHEARPAASRMLIVSGGADPDGTPRLDPAFVVETAAILPDAGGPYELAGRRADGSELFTLGFDMEQVADGDGGAGFTFALPVQPGWESELASLALTGPGGAVEIREGSEPPMAIMRDAVTGRVRAILRHLPVGDPGPGALNALAPEPGLDITVSGGLPAAADWR